MVFLFGFLLGMAGLGLLIAGEVPWLGGRKVPAPTSRKVGTMLVLFFPLALLVRFVVSKFEGDYDINVQVINWSVLILWVIAAGSVLYRGLPAPERKRPAVSLVEPPLPFATEPAAVEFDAPPPEAVPAPNLKKKAKPAAKERNPFDFS